jgi:lysophospholipase L1-like esterase
VLIVARLDGGCCRPPKRRRLPNSQSMPTCRRDTMPLLPLRQGDRVLFLGDSITDAGGISREWSNKSFDGPGWLSRISRNAADHPDLQLQLVNRGIGGNRVPDLLARLQAEVLDAAPTVVVLYIGINDVWHSTSGAGTPEDDYVDGLAKLVRTLRDAGIRVLLCTPSVIGERPEGENELDELLTRYTAISRNTAEELQVPLCDLSAAFRGWLSGHNPANAANGLLTTDGVHLTDEGNSLLADTVVAALGLDSESDD